MSLEKKKEVEVSKEMKKNIDSRLIKYQEGVRIFFYVGCLLSIGYGVVMSLVGKLLGQFISQLGNPFDP